MGKMFYTGILFQVPYNASGFKTLLPNAKIEFPELFSHQKEDNITGMWKNKIFNGIPNPGPALKRKMILCKFDIMQECPLCKNILSTAYSTGSPIKVLTRLRSNIIKQTLWYGIAHGNYDRYPKLYRYKQADDTILNAL